MTLEGITVNLSATSVADVRFQGLLPVSKPLPRVCGFLMEAEVLQPKSDVTFQAAGIDLIAVCLQKSLY